MPGKQTLLIMVVLILGATLLSPVRAAGKDEPVKGNGSEENDAEAAPRATLTVQAANADGPARGNVALTVLGSDGNWRTFSTKALVQGMATFQVGPGTYRAAATSTGDAVGQSHSTGPVELKDGDEVVKKIYFERGKITVVAVDKARNKIDGVLRLDMYDPEGWKCTPLLGNIMVIDGRASVYLAPGRYRLRFTPEGIIGAQEQASGTFEVRDRSDFDFQPKIEYGILKVSSNDYEGPLKSQLTIWAERTLDGKTKHSLAYSRDFDGNPATLKIAPGKYRVAVNPDPRRLLGAAARVFDNVEIASGGAGELKAAFEKGRVALTVHAFDEVAGRIELQKWYEAQKNYATFDTTKLKEGRNDFFLVPGRYRIVVIDTRVTHEAEYPWADIEVKNKSLARRTFYLERGRIRVISNVKGKIVVDARVSDTSRRVCQAELAEGAATINLRPGRYRVTLLPEGSDKGISTDWMELIERSWLMRTFEVGGSGEAGSGEGLPPEVDLYGPFEVGDDDGLLESKERINFSMRFGGKNFAGARVSLLVPKSDGKHKERKIAEITKAGLDKDREQALEGAGEYILKIIAWDSADPCHETTIERRFRVHPRN